MKFIAHRGLWKGKNERHEFPENDPSLIDRALACGFHAEVDIRFINNKLYLGHDRADYGIHLPYLLERAPRLWIHCKDYRTFEYLSKFEELDCFMHDRDPCALTTHGFHWHYPCQTEYSNKSIVLLPETCLVQPQIIPHYVYGVCSDDIARIREGISRHAVLAPK
jgi:hypothetical protein